MSRHGSVHHSRLPCISIRLLVTFPERARVPAIVRTVCHSLAAASVATVRRRVRQGALRVELRAIRRGSNSICSVVAVCGSCRRLSKMESAARPIS